MDSKVTSLSLIISVVLSTFAKGGEWTLDRALGQVVREAPDARVAQLRLEKAKAQLSEARAKWMPKVNAETGYSATDNPTQAFMFLLNQRQLTFGGDFNDPPVTDNWGSGLSFEYPLYTGGARKAGERAAHAGVAASAFEMAAVKRQLQLEVARSYYQILRAGEIVKAAEAALANQQSNLKLASELVDGGKALPTAVLDIETQIARAEADLEAVRNQREIALAMLKSLLGLDDKNVISVNGSWTSIVWPRELGAKPDRPEIKALNERSRQAEAQIEVAKSGKRPQVSAFATGRHDEGFTQPDGGNSWIAGVMVRLNLFNGGETKALVAQAEVDRAILGEQLRKQRQQIELQVKTARLNLETARKRISLAKKAIKSAEESLDLTRARFKEGLLLSTQLIDAETVLTSMRVQLSGARAEEQIALAELRHSLGLPIRNVKENSK